MRWYQMLPVLVFGMPVFGLLWELLAGLFCRSQRWLLWLPVLAWAMGIGLWAASPAVLLPFPFVLLVSGLYGCALLLGWSLSRLSRAVRGTWKACLMRTASLCSGAALAVSFGVLLCHESHFRTTTMVKEQISQEEALAERPELAVSETDRELLSALASCGSLQSAASEGKIASFPPADHPDVQSVLSSYLDADRYRFSDAGVLTVGEEATFYYDVYDQAENIRIMGELLSTGSIRKTIAVYEEDLKSSGPETMYQNTDGNVEKLTEQRLWFHDLIPYGEVF